MPKSAEQVRQAKLARVRELLSLNGLSVNQQVVVVVDGRTCPGRVTSVNPLDGRIGVRAAQGDLWVERSLVSA